MTLPRRAAARHCPPGRLLATARATARACVAGGALAAPRAAQDATVLAAALRALHATPYAAWLARWASQRDSSLRALDAEHAALAAPRASDTRERDNARTELLGRRPMPRA